MKYNGEVIETSDGKQWVYDEKHHTWIEVTMPKKLKGELVRVK